ncbi:MAG: hypothetical protein J0H42_22170 [Rhizobiales bacterium]|nr:hypothetical protein [Hyphomicrobiales bacterium]
MDSQQAIEILQQVIVWDRGALDTVTFFLDMNPAVKGGWEGWLQVTYARWALDSVLKGGNFEREVAFPETTNYCDLKFTPARGANVWLELKTQRYFGYKNTVYEFEGDLLKIQGLSTEFRKNNVVVAAAVFGALSDIDRTMLSDLRNKVKSGSMTYLLFTGKASDYWRDVTKDIVNTKLEASQLLLATFKAS